MLLESSSQASFPLLADVDEAVAPNAAGTGREGIYYSDFIACNPKGPAREPPRAVLDRLRQLDQELGLGARLRRSHDPDFITAVAAGLSCA